jgi:hypothetical protein
VSLKGAPQGRPVKGSGKVYGAEESLRGKYASSETSIDRSKDNIDNNKNHVQGKGQRRNTTANLDLDDDQSFEDFLNTGLSKSTQSNYERYWETWTGYCRARAKDPETADPLLQDVPTTMGKTRVYAKYIWYLRVAVGIAPSALDAYLAAVKDELGTRGVNLTFTDDKIVMIRKAKKAAKKRTRAQLREALIQKDARLKLPFFDLLTDWIYLHFWCEVRWDWDGTFLRMTSVAILVMDVFGFRESNIVRPRPDAEDHTLRAEDLTIMYRNDNGLTLSATGGSEEVTHIQVKQVLAIHVIVASSKRSVEATRKVVSPSDARGVRLIGVLLEWLSRSKVQPDEPLCTCHRVSPENGREYSYSLTSEKLGYAIKAAAQENGYPPEHFASSSLRKGMATRKSLTGARDADIADQGGWKSHAVMHKHYNYGRRLYRASDDKAPLRETEIRILLPHTDTSSSRRDTPATHGGVGHSLPVRRAVATTKGNSSGKRLLSEPGARTFAQRLGYPASLRR